MAANTDISGAFFAAAIAKVRGLQLLLGTLVALVLHETPVEGRKQAEGQKESQPVHPESCFLSQNPDYEKHIVLSRAPHN